jgi:hypothetical protein
VSSSRDQDSSLPVEDSCPPDSYEADLMKMYGLNTPPRESSGFDKSPCGSLVDLVSSPSVVGSPAKKRKLATAKPSGSNPSNPMVFVDHSTACLVRREADGSTVRAKMQQGPNALAVAQFPDSDVWIETEIPNLVLVAQENFKPKSDPSRKKEQGKAKAKGKAMAKSKAKAKGKAKGKAKSKVRAKACTSEPEVDFDDAKTQEEEQEDEEAEQEDEVLVESDEEAPVSGEASAKAKSKPKAKAAPKAVPADSGHAVSDVFCGSFLRATYATNQSYMCAKFPGQKKTLVVAVSIKQSSQHQALVKKMFDQFSKMSEVSKAKALAMRTQLLESQ